MNRTPALQGLLSGIVARTSPSEQEVLKNLLVASDHHYSCRCARCKGWWRAMGPDEDGLYGPFTAEEITAPQEDASC